MFRLGSSPPPEAPAPWFATPGRLVRGVYATVLGALILYGLSWLVRPLVFLEGPGEVKANAQEVSVPFIANIEAMHVKAGQTVFEGTVLATVARADAADTLRELSLRLHNARMQESDLAGRLHVAKSTETSLRERVQTTRERLDRMQTLYSDYATSPHLAALQREHADAVRLESQVQSDLRLLPSTLQRVEAEVATVSDQIAQIQRGWGHILLSAPRNGTVGATTVEAGGTVNPGQSIMTLFDAESTYVLWRLPAFNFRSPEIDDEVTVIQGSKKIRGRIRSILPITAGGPAKSATSGRLAEVELEEESTGLPIGAEVEVRLRNF